MCCIRLVQVSLDDGAVAGLLRCLELSAVKHDSNLKFGKLLLTVVNKYGKQVRLAGDTYGGFEILSCCVSAEML